MQDEKLKELIQAVLDGKELQWDFYYEKDRTGWKPYVNKLSVQNLLKSVVADLGNAVIRIKPEVKTFKYKTRPYQRKDSEGKEEFGLWTTTCGFLTETELEFFCEHNYYDMYFKWLAPTTEYEVEYE